MDCEFKIELENFEPKNVEKLRLEKFRFNC